MLYSEEEPHAAPGWSGEPACWLCPYHSHPRTGLPATFPALEQSSFPGVTWLLIHSVMLTCSGTAVSSLCCVLVHLVNYLFLCLSSEKWNLKDEDCCGLSLLAWGHIPCLISEVTDNVSLCCQPSSESPPLSFLFPLPSPGKSAALVACSGHVFLEGNHDFWHLDIK